MKILCGGPVSEDAEVFAEHIASLQAQGFDVDYKGIDNSPTPLPKPEGFESVDWRTEPTLGEYKNLSIRWSRHRLRLLGRLREEMRIAALDGGYDYLWMVDSDLIPGPDTLGKLLDAGKDFIAGIVWMGDWVNVSRRYGFNYWQPPNKDKDKFKAGGIHQVELTGACSLLSRRALARLSYAGRRRFLWEDNCLAESAREAGIPLFLHADTKIEVRRRRG